MANSPIFPASHLGYLFWGTYSSLVTAVAGYKPATHTQRQILFPVDDVLQHQAGELGDQRP